MVMPSGTPPTAPCTLAPWRGQVITVRRLLSAPAPGSKSKASTALVAVSIQYIVRPSALHVVPFGSRALGMTALTCRPEGVARAVARAAGRARTNQLAALAALRIHAPPFSETHPPAMQP
jgi:hypothetical protein